MHNYKSIENKIIIFVEIKMDDIMAKPIKIKETPTLDGKDVVVFLNKIKASNIKQISTAEQSRILKNYQKLKEIATF